MKHRFFKLTFSSFMIVLVTQSFATAATSDTPRLALKSTSPTQKIMPGDTFDYTLVVFNQGRKVARNVVVIAKLPKGLEQVGKREGCTRGSNIECRLGLLEPGKNVVLKFKVKADKKLPAGLRIKEGVGDLPTDPEGSEQIERIKLKSRPIN